MAHTIYAAFASERDAERAAGALMDHGVPTEAVSFILPQLNDRAPIVAGTPHMPGHAPAPAMMNNRMNDVPIPDTNIPETPLTGVVDLNTGTRVGQDASIPENRPGYTYDALGAVLPDTAPRPMTTMTQQRIDDVLLNSPNQNDPIPYNVPIESNAQIPNSGRLAMAADAPLEVVEGDHGHILDQHRSEPGAASGITTTTAGDAAKGAVEGAGIGLGLGVLLGLATIAIPGIGLIAGAGALVAGLAAATGAAGGVVGGVYGFLHDLGLPADATKQLQTHLESGAPILSITLPNLPGNITEAEIINMLKKYHAVSAQSF